MMACLKNKFLVGAFALAMSASFSAHAYLIDFEVGADGAVPEDNNNIDGVFTDGTTQVEFWLGEVGLDRPVFEAVGSDDDHFGFINPEAGTDTPNEPGAMGDYFARTQGFGETPTFIIQYLTPVDAASGEIWDIDARNNNGYEQWVIRAFDAMDSMLAETYSVTGAPNHPNGETESYNGESYTFGFSGLDGQISRITIDYVGTAGSVGLAFDNFYADTDVTAVPVSGSLTLLGLGFAMLAPLASRRRRVR